MRSTINFLHNSKLKSDCINLLSGGLCNSAVNFYHLIKNDISTSAQNWTDPAPIGDPALSVVQIS